MGACRGAWKDLRKLRLELMSVVFACFSRFVMSRRLGRETGQRKQVVERRSVTMTVPRAEPNV